MVGMRLMHCHREGGKLIVADPRRTDLARLADVHLRLRPGTDVPLVNGLMHIGRSQVPGGRAAEPASVRLSDSIAALGITRARMKTGTPVRIDARSVHFEDMEPQPGETDYHRFSYVSPQRPLQQLPCWTCSTNDDVHRVLRDGLADSPLYNGQIKSIGPRYCPSIETPRQIATSAVSGTRRTGHERNVSERVFLEPADGYSTRSAQENSLLPRFNRL